MEWINIDITHVNYEEIEDKIMSVSCAEIEGIILKYILIGVRPVVGDQFIAVSTDVILEIESICFSDSKIMIECNAFE